MPQLAADRSAYSCTDSPHSRRSAGGYAVRGATMKATSRSGSSRRAGRAAAGPATPAAARTRRTLEAQHGPRRKQGAATGLPLAQHVHRRRRFRLRRRPELVQHVPQRVDRHLDLASRDVAVAGRHAPRRGRRTNAVIRVSGHHGRYSGAGSNDDGDHHFRSPPRLERPLRGRRVGGGHRDRLCLYTPGSRERRYPLERAATSGWATSRASAKATATDCGPTGRRSIRPSCCSIRWPAQSTDAGRWRSPTCRRARHRCAGRGPRP